MLSLLYPKPPPKSKISIPAPNIKNPSINVPVPQPEIAVVKESQALSFIEKTIETFSGWFTWLAESDQKYIVKPISSTLKNLKQNINKIFEEEEEKVEKEVIVVVHRSRNNNNKCIIVSLTM